MDLIHSALIFSIGFIGSFIGSLIGGGGGLITVPALIFFGLPPSVAIATNRFGALGSASAAIYRFNKSKVINWRFVIPFCVISLMGSIIGAKILIDIDKVLLSRIIGITLFFILPLTIIKKDYGLISKTTSRNKKTAGFLGYFGIAIYEGFFGAAAGILSIYLYIYAFGMKYIQANATEKLPWLINIFASLIIFANAGLINYTYGITILAGMTAGSYLGAHTAVKLGNRFAKTLLSIFVIFSAIKLLLFE